VPNETRSCRCEASPARVSTGQEAQEPFARTSERSVAYCVPSCLALAVSTATRESAGTDWRGLHGRMWVGWSLDEASACGVSSKLQSPFGGPAVECEQRVGGAASMVCVCGGLWLWGLGQGQVVCVVALGCGRAGPGAAKGKPPWPSLFPTCSECKTVVDSGGATFGHFVCDLMRARVMLGLAYR